MNEILVAKNAPFGMNIKNVKKLVYNILRKNIEIVEVRVVSE